MATKLPQLPNDKRPSNPPPRAGAGSAKKGAKKGAGGGGGVKQLAPHVAVAFDAEEEKARAEVAKEENLCWAVLALQRQEATLDSLTSQSGQSLSHLTSLTTNFEAQAAHVGTSASRLDTLTQGLNRLSERLLGYIDTQSSSERAKHLDVESRLTMASREMEELRLECSRLKADNQGLRDTLNRRILRVTMDHDDMRAAVKHAIDRQHLDWGQVQKELHQRVDAAVLEYHKPNQFQTALESLRTIAQDTETAVQEHSKRLHLVIDSIGSDDEVVAVKTMHTNLPPHHTAALANFTKEQLVNLVHVLSFEEGVVPVVGRAIYANNADRPNQVFL